MVYELPREAIKTSWSEAVRKWGESLISWYPKGHSDTSVKEWSQVLMAASVQGMISEEKLVRSRDVSPSSALQRELAYLSFMMLKGVVICGQARAFPFCPLLSHWDSQACMLASEVWKCCPGCVSLTTPAWGIESPQMPLDFRKLPLLLSSSSTSPLL